MELAIFGAEGLYPVHLWALVHVNENEVEVKRSICGAAATFRQAVAKCTCRRSSKVWVRSDQSEQLKELGRVRRLPTGDPWMALYLSQMY